MTIHRTLVAALAGLAIAAPAAQARVPDMHASTAQAAAQERQRQDLRGEHARDAASNPRPVNEPGATAGGSQSKVTPGQTVPDRLLPPAQAVSSSSDDGVDWTTIGIGVGITLLVLGLIAAVTSRSRSLPRTRVSA